MDKKELCISMNESGFTCSSMRMAPAHHSAIAAELLPAIIRLPATAVMSAQQSADWASAACREVTGSGGSKEDSYGGRGQKEAGGQSVYRGRSCWAGCWYTGSSTSPGSAGSREAELAGCGSAPASGE